MIKNVYIWGTGQAAKALHNYFYDHPGYKILGCLEWNDRLENIDQRTGAPKTWPIEHIKINSNTAIWIPGIYEDQITRKLTSFYNIPQKNINLWLPKLIILTLNGLSTSHGIGVQVDGLVKRTGYPRSHILSIACWTDNIESEYDEIRINPRESKLLTRQKTKIRAFLGNKKAQLWSFAVEAEDFYVTRWISQTFHEQLIQRRLHMYDFFPAESKVNLVNLLDWKAFEVSTSIKRIAELFLNKGIEVDYKPYLFTSKGINRDTTCKPSSEKKNRLNSPSFVIIGNLWHKTSKDGCPTLIRLDELCRALPTNQINWYCCPIRAAQQFQRVKDLGVEIVNIAYRGMAHNLEAVLQKYDIGIVYFGEQEEAETNYEKYSFPSRILEYLFAGIPILIISPRGTYLNNMIIGTKIGWSFTKSEFYNLSMEDKSTLFSYDQIEKRRLNCLTEAKRISSSEEIFFKSFRI